MRHSICSHRFRCVRLVSFVKLVEGPNRDRKRDKLHPKSPCLHKASAILLCNGHGVMQQKRFSFPPPSGLTILVAVHNTGHGNSMIVYLTRLFMEFPGSPCSTRDVTLIFLYPDTS